MSQATTTTNQVGFHVVRETWSSRVHPIPGDTIVLMIGTYGSPNNWEFAIAEEHLHSGPCLRVKVFDDAWQAFVEIPEFFTGLAALGEGATVEQVVALMTSLGFEDQTVRERPTH